MNYTIHTLKPGMKVSGGRTVTQADSVLFSGVSGDTNPAHFDAEYAKTTPFGRPIAHGMIALSYCTALLAMQLPGSGSIYLGQEVRYLAPVYFGDTVTAEVEVIEVDVSKRKARLRTSCINQDGTVVLDGVATIRPPSE